MILHLIERYYNYYWFIFLVAIFCKIIVAMTLVGNPNGMVGIFEMILKWHSGIDFSLVESPVIRLNMRLQNICTLGMVLSGVVVGSVWLLKYLF